ncbi:DUF11 domain-containing protein [Polaribacter sp. IC073]|uniref:DUF11 domain-containing protein n=1 Tax=Polaribacter sp. IC073 TaxID=2508540 RepID=UPI0016784B72|nr:DUF11 domain-containing protein [Polaribacter sp. IC073]
MSCFIDASLIKKVDSPVIKLGSLVFFSVFVTNNGGLIANDVKIKDVLPKALIFSELASIIPGSTIYEPITGIWSLGNLQFKQRDIFTLKLAATIEVTGILKINKEAVFSFHNQQNEIDSYPKTNN